MLSSGANGWMSANPGRPTGSISIVRVQLHGARPQRDHAAVQREVLVGEAAKVAQHRCLGVVVREDGVIQDRSTAQERRGAGRCRRALPRIGPEGTEHSCDVVRRGRLAARDPDMVLVHEARSTPRPTGVIDDRRRPAGRRHDDGVEEVLVRQAETGLLESGRQVDRAPVDAVGDAAQPLAPWYTAYMEATTANSTWAVQMFNVAFSRRMCYFASAGRAGRRVVPPHRSRARRVGRADRVPAHS